MMTLRTSKSGSMFLTARRNLLTGGASRARRPWRDYRLLHIGSCNVKVKKQVVSIFGVLYGAHESLQHMSSMIVERNIRNQRKEVQKNLWCHEIRRVADILSQRTALRRQASVGSPCPTACLTCRGNSKYVREMMVSAVPIPRIRLVIGTLVYRYDKKPGDGD